MASGNRDITGDLDKDFQNDVDESLRALGFRECGPERLGTSVTRCSGLVPAYLSSNPCSAFY